MFVLNHRAGYLLFCILSLAFMLALTGCESKPPAAPDTRAADETAIRAADAANAKAVAAYDVAGAVSACTDDVVGMDPTSPVVIGKENMRQFLETMFKDKPDLSWTITKVEVARSGDLAYSYGAGKISMKPKKGKPTEETAKYVSVWKKQTDGSWKIIVNTMIPDPPAKPAATKHAKSASHKKSHKK